MIIERGIPGETIVVKRMDGRRTEGKCQVHEETIVNVVRIGGDTNVAVNKGGKKTTYKLGTGGDHSRAVAGPARPGTLGPLVTLGHSFQDARWAANDTNTDLGSRDSEGERADVKRTSYTIRCRLAKSVTSIRLLSLQNPDIRRICW